MSDQAKSLPAPILKVAPDGKLTPRRRRRILIQMSLRKQKPGTGSSYEFLRRRTAMKTWPDLRAILEGIRWTIVGGIATRAYMPERVTHDMDILVMEADGEEAIKRLKDAGYTLESQLTISRVMLRSPDGVEIDLLIGDMPWLAEALEDVQPDPAGYPVLSLPYLSLMKLTSARTQDWADLSRMLGLASEADLNRIREVVARYSPEDVEDLESLIILGKREMEPPSKGETQ